MKPLPGQRMEAMKLEPDTADEMKVYATQTAGSNYW